VGLGAGRTYGEVTASDAGSRDDSAEAARSAISATLLLAMAVATRSCCEVGRVDSLERSGDEDASRVLYRHRHMVEAVHRRGARWVTQINELCGGRDPTLDHPYLSLSLSPCLPKY
jgi:hypothetical protein